MVRRLKSRSNGRREAQKPGTESGSGRVRKRPGFTVRLSEPPACSVFVLRPDGLDSIVFRSPAALFSACRVNAKERVIDRLASCRSRRLGTAFRSPVTTLSTPLRGPCSRPAPSLPCRVIFANPFDPEFLRSVRFRSRTGRVITPDPLSAPISGTLMLAAGLHSPSGCFNPPDRSVQPVPATKSSPRLAPSCLSLPAAISWISPRIVAQNPVSSCSAIVPQTLELTR